MRHEYYIEVTLINILKMKKVLLFLSIALLVSCSDCKEDGQAGRPEVRNVIFMIGDGMGPAQVYAGLTHNGGHLTLEEFPFVGLVKTYSANRYITDSAAGGTALATGNKTNNGMIGVTPDTMAVMSSLMEAHKAGMATGIVVTSPVTHATPASFYAHQPSREMYEDIALDLEKSGIDVFIGGGRAHFEKRSDSVDVSARMREAGYNIVYSEEELAAVQGGKVGALLADIDMPRASERGDYLPSAVRKAISLLDGGGKGFFLMVEGSQIDYRCHGNEAVPMAGEMIDFDRAVKAALDFAKKDGHTLVVVTADHETGGVTLTDGSYETGEIECHFSTGDHTGTFVPMFAFGPGAEQFTGIVDNTSFKDKFVELLGISVE